MTAKFLIVMRDTTPPLTSFCPPSKITNPRKLGIRNIFVSPEHIASTHDNKAHKHCRNPSRVCSTTAKTVEHKRKNKLALNYKRMSTGGSTKTYNA